MELENIKVTRGVTLHSSWQCEVSVGPQLGIPPVQQSEQGRRLLPPSAAYTVNRRAPAPVTQKVRKLNLEESLD